MSSKVSEQSAFAAAAVAARALAAQQARLAAAQAAAVAAAAARGSGARPTPDLFTPASKPGGITLTIASTANTAAIDQLVSLTGAANQASGAVKTANEQLAAHLAVVGNALDPRQRAALTEMVFGDLGSPDIRTVQADALDALEANLAANRTALLDAARTDPAARVALYGALQSLVNGGRGTAALQLLGEIQRDPASPLAKAFAAEFPKLDEDITQLALPAALTELVGKSGGNAQVAMQQLRTLIDPLKTAWDGVEGAQKVRDMLGALDDAASGRFDKLAELVKTVQSPLMKGLASAAILVGSFQATTDLAQGKYLEAMKSIAQSGEKGFELLAGATALAAKTAKVSPFLAKLAPGLGLVANATSLALNLQAAGANGPNLGYAVAALGDAIAVMGSAFELIPGGQVPGALFNGFGAAVSAVGTFIGGAIDADRKSGELSRLLERSGIAQPLAGRLARIDPTRIDTLLKFGFSLEQIQTLGSKSELVLKTFGQGGPDFAALAPRLQKLGLTTQQLYGLLLAADAAGGGTGIEAVLRTLERDGGAQYAQSKTALIAALRAAASHYASSQKSEADAIVAAATALERSMQRPRTPQPRAE